MPPQEDSRSSSAMSEEQPSPLGDSGEPVGTLRWNRKQMLHWGIALVVALVVIGAAWAGTIILRSYGPISSKTTTVHPAEYKTYAEGIEKIKSIWLEQKADLETAGTSPADLKLAARDFISFFGSTILLKMQLESTLTADEQKELTLRLLDVGLDPEFAMMEKGECEWIEEKLPLQDFFVGATLKFTKPMIYLDSKEEKAKDCSPTLSSEKFYLESVESWGHIIFDKSRIIEHPVDPSTTFTVEGRVKVKRGGLFPEERQHYILHSSNGMTFVPSFLVFDVDGLGSESGSELYRGTEYVGHVISDPRTGGVWIEGGSVPQEVIDANTYHKSTIFETTTAKKTEFMERVMFAIDEGKFASYNNQELMALDLAKDLYTYKNGEVISDFGGKVYLQKSGADISVVYENVPKDSCFEFYYVNDPSIDGFKESYIDGALEQYPSGGYSNDAINDFKQKACYSGKKTVTIEFRGKIEEIKKQANFFRQSRAPKY